MVRFPLALVAGFGFAAALPAQPAKPAETIAPGDCFRVELSLAVSGKLKVQLPGGKVGSESLEATATHSYAERVEAVDAGIVTRAVRAYAKASATHVVSGGKQVRELPAHRRTIAIQQTVTGPLHFHPTDPLTREELELVSEHFDTLALPRLIPANYDRTGVTWKLPDELVKALCQLDGLTVNALVGKWVSSSKGGEDFSVEGTAEGTERGATVKLSIKARVAFGNTNGRITYLMWEQTDERGQGPSSPAMDLKATITLNRVPLAENPEELSATAKARIPFGKVPEAVTLLRHADPAGKYSLLYTRDWYVTAQTGDHLVLRLIEQGDWVAQATILSLKPSADGKHMTAEAFKAAIAKQPGWEPAGVAADGELPAGPGRWLYRVTGAGKQDGLAVVQSFYCLAEGTNQVVITVVARDDRAAKLNARDLALVTAIEFPAKK